LIELKGSSFQILSRRHFHREEIKHGTKHSNPSIGEHEDDDTVQNRKKKQQLAPV